ncbi:MAG TPA: HAD-IB family hydrolase [Steroidobacteraceae bacterium]|nr:HAD-IB family hydrolase [Steroidobacteraceae bacterium]
MAEGGPVKLAVFDLDGTITRHDTLLPFVLGFARHTPWRLAGILLFLPHLALFVLGVSDRGALKSAFIRCTLAGVRRSQIDSWAARFVPTLLERGVFAQALEHIARHKQEGARLALLSASTDLYVPAIGKALGFDEVICTGVRWEGDRLEGHLTTPNRRGPEKARCLESLRNAHPGLVTAAYGNAGSDLEHLQLAERPLLINPSHSARRAAQRLGIPCASWR